MNEITKSPVIHGELLDKGDGPEVFAEIINCECGSPYHYRYKRREWEKYFYNNVKKFDAIKSKMKNICIYHNYIDDEILSNFKLS